MASVRERYGRPPLPFPEITVPIPRFTLLMLAACLLLAIGAPPATSTPVTRVAWTDELGDNARPGPLHYVALGDSFTSGEGDPYVDPVQEAEYVGQDAARRCALAPQDLKRGCYAQRPPMKEIVNAVGWLGDTGTDVDKLTGYEARAAKLADGYSFGGNNCHRSSSAYPARVWGMLDAEDPNWGITFAACSGAEVVHVDESFRGEGPQWNAFAGEPADLITIGFGGNDIGFGDIVQCLVVGTVVGLGTDRCNPLPMDDKLAELDRSLGAVIERIRTSNVLDQGGRTIAVGYPRLFPVDPPNWCNLGSASQIDRKAMLWLNEVANRLNAHIEATAAAHGIEYVDVADIIAALDQNGVRHDFCVKDDDQRWVNLLIPSDVQRRRAPQAPVPRARRRPNRRLLGGTNSQLRTAHLTERANQHIQHSRTSSSPHDLAEQERGLRVADAGEGRSANGVRHVRSVVSARPAVTERDSERVDHRLPPHRPSGAPGPVGSRLRVTRHRHLRAACSVGK